MNFWEVGGGRDVKGVDEGGVNWIKSWLDGCRKGGQH